jgi:integrase
MKNNLPSSNLPMSKKPKRGEVAVSSYMNNEINFSSHHKGNGVKTMADMFNEAPKGDVQPWHEAVGDLMARRYQSAGWNRLVLLRDWALLRKLCGTRHPSEIEYVDLDDVVIAMRNAGNTQSSIDSHIARTKSIFETLRIMKVIPHDHHPEKGFPKEKKKRYTPRPISHDQALMLMSKAKEPFNEFFTLACMAGLRAMEIANIRGDWLEQGEEGWNLRVYGKGKTELVIPAHQRIVELIQSKNTQGRLYYIEPAYLSQLANAEMRRLGIETRNRNNKSRISLHSCRHYFATAIYSASGRDLILTSRVMRHANPQTTLRYADLVNGDENRVVNKLFQNDEIKRNVLKLVRENTI